MNAEEKKLKKKEAKAAYMKKYNASNKTRKAAYQRQYNEDNKERKTKYYGANKEKISEYNKKYRTDNKEKMTEYNTKYYETNKEQLAAHSRQYYYNNKEEKLAYQKQYNDSNKDRKKEYDYQHYRNNKERIIKYKTQYKRNRMSVDPLFKATEDLRTLVKHALKRGGHRKSKRTETLLGCTFQEAKEHIESQFKEGMTWDNHGFDTWHIDHIIPLSSATTVEEVEKLCHYTNLQPLWALENMIKGDKID